MRYATSYQHCSPPDDEPISDYAREAMYIERAEQLETDIHAWSEAAESHCWLLAYTPKPNYPAEHEGNAFLAALMKGDEAEAGRIARNALRRQIRLMAEDLVDDRVGHPCG